MFPCGQLITTFRWSSAGKRAVPRTELWIRRMGLASLHPNHYYCK